MFSAVKKSRQFTATFNLMVMFSFKWSYFKKKNQRIVLHMSASKSKEPT